MSTGFPIVPRYEIVGRVTKVSSGVTKYNLGDGSRESRPWEDSCRCRRRRRWLVRRHRRAAARRRREAIKVMVEP